MLITKSNPGFLTRDLLKGFITRIFKLFQFCYGIQTTKKRKHEIFVLNEKAATPEEHQSAVSEKEETKHEGQGCADHADPEPKHAKPSTTEPEHQLQINNDDHEDLGVVNFWEDGIIDLPDMGQISEVVSNCLL